VLRKVFFINTKQIKFMEIQNLTVQELEEIHGGASCGSAAGWGVGCAFLGAWPIGTILGGASCLYGAYIAWNEC
jgi:hypothetical protein